MGQCRNTCTIKRIIYRPTVSPKNRITIQIIHNSRRIISSTAVDHSKSSPIYYIGQLSVTKTIPYANIILRKLLVTLAEKIRICVRIGRGAGVTLIKLEIWKPKNFFKKFYEKMTKKFFQLRSGYLFL